LLVPEKLSGFRVRFESDGDSKLPAEDALASCSDLVSEVPDVLSSELPEPELKPEELDPELPDERELVPSEELEREVSEGFEPVVLDEVCEVSESDPLLGCQLKSEVFGSVQELPRDEPSDDELSESEVVSDSDVVGSMGSSSSSESVAQAIPSGSIKKIVGKVLDRCAEGRGNHFHFELRFPPQTGSLELQTGFLYTGP
jgi:hypothetical protein